ncbi:mRNA-binding ribosome synthesis protein [Cichlidogyrus casuarinus]|uniref:Pescadillo homolog n=1 Tax=Cichlidogyrus casuarinus TaxID=1844966 RepID=A0ABD2PU54_9PLAT
MGCGAKAKKKYESGSATSYLTQKQAMRKLQVGLTNFRRLCILKGIYPVEPKHRNRANKGNTQPRVFYYAKDILFLLHEPLLETFRKLRVYQRKLRQAKARDDRDEIFRIRINKPSYTLHEIVKERYPTPDDAVRDMNDSLNLIFLFARLPRLPQFHPGLIKLSKRLSVEFLNFVVATRAIRKAFISIKGFYLEAEIKGITIVWIIPHNSTTHCPSETFTARDLDFEYLACLSFPIKKTVVEDEVDEEDADLMELKQMDDSVTQALSKQAEVIRTKRLFEGKRFYLNREVPREVMTVIIRSCGGLVSWDPVCGPGSTFKENDEQVDYQVVDRPMKDMKVGRNYVQPQWVVDSLNASRLMPVQDYMPGVELPAHLSPFALAVSQSADPNLRVKTRETPLSGAAPGYGAGADLYRPPEADYLAGLVTLAEIRGGPVVAQKEAQQENYDELDEASDEDDEDEEQEMETEDEEEIVPPAKKKKKIAMTPGKKASIFCFWG